MKLTMLGTGNALVTDCYNTCFLIENNGEFFMVDGGGGNTILKQLNPSAKIGWIFVIFLLLTSILIIFLE